jgi:hypothetical protein
MLQNAGAIDGTLIDAERQSASALYCLTWECSPKRNCCLTENVPVAWIDGGEDYVGVNANSISA